MDEIRWEDPPTTRRGDYMDWHVVLAPLMQHPKRWAVIAVKPTAQKASSAAGGLRAGRISKPPGRWEFVSRKVGGEHRVYGRYLGPDEDGAS